MGKSLCCPSKSSRGQMPEPEKQAGPCTPRSRRAEAGENRRGTGPAGLPAQENMQAPGSAKMFCPKETRQKVRRRSQLLWHPCVHYAAYIHITAAIKVWMEIFCMGGSSSSQKVHVYLHENPSSGFPVSCWPRTLLWPTSNILCCHS